MNLILILFGKLLLFFSRTFNLGSGSTWPGHIAISLNSNFIRHLTQPAKSDKRTVYILVAGTNGKTTTSSMISKTLQDSGKRVFQNESGANLLNGIASSLLLHSAILSTRIDYDFAIFEVDENSLPLVLKELTPDFLVVLNLFRDQLDRYGEVNIIAKKWKEAISILPKTTTLVLNADDPQIVYLGKDIEAQTKYFGLKDTRSRILEHENISAADSVYCPNCNSKLKFKSVYFSHLGDWSCTSCKFTRPALDLSNSPVYPLPGTYNIYNTNAASLVAQLNHINHSAIRQSLSSFSPAFGRQEEIEHDGKKIKIFLSKNPTSFNESLRTIVGLGGKNILFVLNDRIPDGRDVSWIWDTDIESYIKKFKDITIAGDRCYDMGLRIKYAFDEFKISNFKFKIEESLKDAISEALDRTKTGETLYILPTYSAMLEIRKILTGKKIL